jgi:hypothetical protein
MKTFELFDVIALTADLPEENLWRGQVGAIVEVYENGKAFEVEFVDTKGVTYNLLALRPDQFMLLHYQAAEKIAA